MIDKNDSSEKTTDGKITTDKTPDETTHLFVYGNITIKDIRTGEILVNKSF